MLTFHHGEAHIFIREVPQEVLELLVFLELLAIDALRFVVEDVGVFCCAHLNRIAFNSIRVVL